MSLKYFRGGDCIWHHNEIKWIKLNVLKLGFTTHSLQMLIMFTDTCKMRRCMVTKTSAQTKRLEIAIEDCNGFVPVLTNEAVIEEDHITDGNWPWITTGEQNVINLIVRSSWTEPPKDTFFMIKVLFTKMKRTYQINLIHPAGKPITLISHHEVHCNPFI